MTIAEIWERWFDKEIENNIARNEIDKWFLESVGGWMQINSGIQYAGRAFGMAPAGGERGQNEKISRQLQLLFGANGI